MAVEPLTVFVTVLVLFLLYIVFNMNKRMEKIQTKVKTEIRSRRSRSRAKDSDIDSCSNDEDQLQTTVRTTDTDDDRVEPANRNQPISGVPQPTTLVRNEYGAQTTNNFNLHIGLHIHSNSESGDNGGLGFMSNTLSSYIRNYLAPTQQGPLPIKS